MPSIVQVPRDRKADYDYIAFSFDGLHSYEDFGIYRVSEGNNGYNENITSVLTDKTADVVGADGQYFLGTQHKNRVFNIKFAFDNLTESKLQRMRKWLNGKNVGDLWFAEAPHKVYSAKVTGSATITSVAFYTGKGERVYKGTGNVQFTCFYPHAHTPDIVRTIDGSGNIVDLSGNESDSYAMFNNFKEIQRVLPYSNVGEDDMVYGDLPSTFKATLMSPFENGNILISMDKGGAIYTLVDVEYSKE